MNELEHRSSELVKPNSIRAVEPSHAANLVTLFFGLAKTLRMVGPENETYRTQLTKFWDGITIACTDTPTFTIKKISDRFFVNEILCRFSHGSLPPGADALSHLWDAIHLGGVEITPAAGNEGVTALISILSGIDSRSFDPATLREALDAAPLPGIKLYSSEEVDTEQHSRNSGERRRLIRRAARSVFSKSLFAIGDVYADCKAGKDVNVGAAKKTIHTLIDQLILDEASLVELSAIRDFDDYTFAHSVNVCVYSLIIGLNLGMEKRRLSELGFTAFFHDVGKVRLPLDLIRKPATFDENDWNQMRRHPLLGAKTILRSFVIDTHSIRSAIGAFEHHINVDGGGYPKRTFPRPLNLYSRIITVADTYDALTSGRVYIKEPIPPVEVVRAMMYQIGSKYDQLLLKIFVNCIGLYPAGTLVLLSTDEVAVVERPNNSKPGLPLVRIIGEKTSLFSAPLLVDLACSDKPREIVRHLNPIDCGFDIGQLILSDKVAGS